MFSLLGPAPASQGPLHRRAFLRFGCGLASPLLLHSAVQSGSPIENEAGARAKRCVILFLLGGPCQHSTWDPKPLASEEIRGPFGSTATSVPGIHIGELLPQLAARMHRLSLLRAVSTDDHAHSSSGYFMLTGHPHQPMNFENANPGAPNNWPTLGAVVQHLRRGEATLPPAVRLPQHIFNTDQSVWPGQDSGFLGTSADPWLFRCEPASRSFRVPEFQLPMEVSPDRMLERRELLRRIDGHLSAIERGGSMDGFSEKQRQAFRVLSGSQSRNALDLTAESPATRERYGHTQFGQSVLLARRLLEADVSLVQVNWFRGPDEPANAPCWDSHADEPGRLKRALAPVLDQAAAALLDDLQDRRMLDDTLVVIMGEFGRTPKFNALGGRDHWGHVFSVALAGGGVRGGSVHGESDRQGGFPLAGLVRPQDLTATVFHCLGFSPRTEIHDALGRPFPISPGRVVHEILT